MHDLAPHALLYMLLDGIITVMSSSVMAIIMTIMYIVL